ncbi:MAG: TauD/TfdA dioxygenase family protein [Candidatus Velthaea sp.]
MSSSALHTMTVHPLHPPFAGEVAGVDVRRIQDPAQVADLRELLDEFGVLVFRKQPFEDDEQVAFAQRLDGELHVKTGLAVIAQEKARLKNAAVTDISNLDESDEPMARDDRRRMYSLGNRLWHTDASFQDPPGRYSMLSAKTVPPEGGETEYADMRAAYDALPDSLKRRIEGLRAHHSIVHSRRTIGFTDFSPQEEAALPGADHPLVRVLPGSQRRSLYIASHASHIIDWPVPEGRLLLMDLMARATRPKFVYRHHWRAGDFVVWDNRCTMHRGLPFDETRYRRDLRRVTTLDL